jgi:hypothetical protein
VTDARRPFLRSCVAERLETRCALAGDVWVGMHNEMLVIWGDASANGVVLTYDSTTQSYRVSGTDAGGSPTTINGLDTSQPGNVVPFHGVKQVYVGTNGGDDEFSVGSPAAVDTVIRQWLSIEMGDGNDKVVLGQGGNAPGGDAPPAMRLRTGTSVSVNLGAGDDQLALANAEIGLHLNIMAEDGNDDVSFATEFTPDGASQSVLFPVMVRGGAGINLGGGEDELDIQNSIFQRHLNIGDGAGLAHINLDNLSISKKLDIDTGHSDDDLNINFVNARDLTIDSNNGVDDVDLTNCRFRTMILKLGSHRDFLLLRQVRVSFLTRLEGGEGGSRLAGSSNTLRGLTRKNIG